MLSAAEAQPIDYLVETSGLNSSEVLATLFILEMKGIVRQLPGKQFTKLLLWRLVALNLLQRRELAPSRDGKCIRSGALSIFE